MIFTRCTGAVMPLLLHNLADLVGTALSFVKESVLMSRFMFVMATGLAAFSVSGAVAQAKPHLRDVPEVENLLFAVALADAIRDNCDDIDARVLRALGQLRRTRALANKMGYSDAEIRAHVESDSEKARMRAKGKEFLAQNGVSLSDPASVCAFGRSEIEKNSAIGALLKAR